MLLLAPLLAACTGPSHGADGLTGTAVAVDDTGLGDSPIDEGWIVAVPSPAVDDLWSSTDNKPIGQQDLPYMKAQLNRDQVSQAGGVVASLDDDGEFVLPAKQGEHLLCYLKQTQYGGEAIRGCGFLTLPASGELRITLGEGGFSAQMKE